MKEQIKELLLKQLQLLQEISEETDDVDDLTELTKSMCLILDRVNSMMNYGYFD